MASRQGGHDAEGVSVSGPTTRAGANLPPRDPVLYAQTDHFTERLHQTGRYVTLPLVAHVIRDGQLRYNPTDGWRFAAVVEGVRTVVVVGDTDTDSPVLVTAWTEVADREVAAASDRWSSLDVETIGLRETMSEERDTPIPGRIRSHVVTRPFEMAGHTVATDAGEAFVECVECGGRFRSKRALADRGCRVGGPHR
ncbi:MAG: hypothetical protein ABEI75_04690 [Halobaculum sp.]